MSPAHSLLRSTVLALTAAVLASLATADEVKILTSTKASTIAEGGCR